jgi:hypothetical protein
MRSIKALRIVSVAALGAQVCMASSPFRARFKIDLLQMHFVGANWQAASQARHRVWYPSQGQLWARHEYQGSDLRTHRISFTDWPIRP